MRSLATSPFKNPSTGCPTDRSIAEVTKAQKQASFTLGVTPTSVLELANVGATLASSGKWCPPSPIESMTDPTGAAVPVTEAPCEQVVDPALAETLLTGLSKDDEPGRTNPPLHRPEQGRRAGRPAGECGRRGRRGPAYARQDRHHPAAQVRGVL